MLTPSQVVARYREHFPTWFDIYLDDNIHVYQQIEKLALAACMRRNRYGIDMLVGAIRWSSATSEVGTEYKVSNDAAAYFARIFHLQHPNHRIVRMKPTRIERQNKVEPPK
jgi:hypothetical protein